MITARWHQTATLLGNGKVLIAGGQDTAGQALSSAELYDPASGTWSATGSMHNARYWHTATMLPNGQVLVTGGMGTSPASAELYDPITGTWATTGSLSTPRSRHTATLLPNGQVLVAGGANDQNLAIVPCELYNPATGTWTNAKGINYQRFDHTATLLPNGTVLALGGVQALYPYSATYLGETYDPQTDTWAYEAYPRYMLEPNAQHTATLLPDGRVLLAGGVGDSSRGELRDPGTGVWTFTPNMQVGHVQHTATLLNDGKVLVAGGFDPISSGATATTELFDPATNTWTTVASMANPRMADTATLLNDGSVLVTGGSTSDTAAGVTATAERYQAPPPPDPALHLTRLATSTSSGHKLTLKAAFSDDDPNGTITQFTATIGWGDGASSTAAIKKNKTGLFVATGTHTYAKAGSYTVTVLVQDVGGASTSGSKSIRIR